jgi:hypothetical protein
MKCFGTGFKGVSDISESESGSGESDNTVVNAFNSESETSETESVVSDHVAVMLPTKQRRKAEHVAANGLKNANVSEISLL